MKHTTYTKLFAFAFWFIILVEVASFWAHIYAPLNTVLFFLLTAGTFIIGVWKFRYAFWIAAVELFIGSFGYLFYFDIGDIRLSIRLGIFMAVCAAWLIYSIREKRFALFKTRYTLPLGLLFLFIAVGAMQGIIRGHALVDVFLDMNGYLYFGMLFPALSVITSWKNVLQLWQLLVAAVSVMILKTLFLFTYFAHQADDAITRLIYTWVRDTRVGEIGVIIDSYYRIFFQSHVWILFVCIIAALLIVLNNRKLLSQADIRFMRVLFIGTSMVLLISYSRSLWLALGITMVLMIIYLWRREKIPWRRLFAYVGYAAMVLVIDMIVITGLVNISLPGGGHGMHAGSLVTERITETDEPALRSRFELLKPLAEQYTASPIVGTGFGTRVTFQSLDPRTKEVNGGMYSTYSFEWGYLGTMVKIGLIGLMAYLFLLWRIFKQGMQKYQIASSPFVRIMIIGLLFSLISLLVVHSTTPYLNHPLGIFLIVLCAAAFAVTDDQGVSVAQS